MIGSINSPHDELIERHVHDQREISSGSRILKWRYVSTIFLAIFCGEMTIEMSIIAPLLRHFLHLMEKKGNYPGKKRKYPSVKTRMYICCSSEHKKSEGA